MEGDMNLCLQLRKLSGINSEEELESVLTLLWKTRKTGLKTAEKSSLQSVLNLPSAAELDLSPADAASVSILYNLDAPEERGRPILKCTTVSYKIFKVLVCLRSIIRKTAQESFVGPDILKLFPPDLPVDLQSMLVKLLQKYQTQWKEELSEEQIVRGTTTFSDEVNVGFQPPLGFHSPEVSALLWPHLDYSVSHCDNNIQGACSLIADGVIPRLKSMTWTLESQNSMQSDRAAIVSLKLQDYTKSPPGEIEVKFRLKQDTLEAVIRSLAYISEKLLKQDESSLEPFQKKQRQ